MTDRPDASSITDTQLDQLHADLDQAGADRDDAYRERAHLTAWLATIHPAVIARATDIDEPGWQILYLTAGGRQLSWHIHPRDAELYDHVEQVAASDPRAQWDGHTTEQKYEAIRSLTFGQLRGPAPRAHESSIWEDCGEWNVSCNVCPAYIDNIGNEDDAEQWAEAHKAEADQ